MRVHDKLGGESKLWKEFKIAMHAEPGRQYAEIVAGVERAGHRGWTCPELDAFLSSSAPTSGEPETP